MKKARNLGNSALRELAQRIQRDMENLPGMSDEEMKREAEKWLMHWAHYQMHRKMKDYKI